MTSPAVKYMDICTLTLHYICAKGMADELHGLFEDLDSPTGSVSISC